MTPTDELRELEEFFYAKIPITHALGIRVQRNDANGVTLVAPVAINHNHLGTAFGGSIYAVMTLTAYGFVWLQTRALAPEVVVQQSTIKFLRPIRETIQATCEPAPEAKLGEFMETLRTHGRARLVLTVNAEENGEVCAVCTGTFLATIAGRNQSR